MYFQKLEKKYQEAIKALAVDAEFQKRFNEDEVLNKLDEEKFDPSICFSELCSTVGIPLVIDDKKYNSVKLFQYVYLWCIDSPLTKDNGKNITELDLDIFFYTLDNKIDSDAVSLSIKALGEVKRRNLTFENAMVIARTLINLAFQPLRMFPSTSSAVVGNQQPAFDADWLTSMVAKVHDVTGNTPDYIMNNMSLSACCFYYIQWCRIQGAQNISKRTSEEILKAQSERTDEMIAERLIELKVLKEEEKQEFINTIRTPPIDK